MTKRSYTKIQGQEVPRPQLTKVQQRFLLALLLEKHYKDEFSTAEFWLIANKMLRLLEGDFSGKEIDILTTLEEYATNSVNTKSIIGKKSKRTATYYGRPVDEMIKNHPFYILANESKYYGDFDE